MHLSLPQYFEPGYNCAESILFCKLHLMCLCGSEEGWVGCSGGGLKGNTNCATHLTSPPPHPPSTDFHNKQVWKGN